MTSKEERLRQIAEIVNRRDGNVSVRDIAEELDLSTSYVCKLAREAIEKDLIDGERSVPVLGYIFNQPEKARADGGTDRDGELHVLPTRKALLWAVRKYAPERYNEAVGLTLEELRRFVRNEVADGTVPVNRAWRFHPV